MVIYYLSSSNSDIFISFVLKTTPPRSIQ